MTTLSIITMVFILGLIVGGFIYFLSLAMRNEKNKKDK